MRRNNKKVVAVIMVILMIAFLLPTFGGPGTTQDPVVAHAFGRPLRGSDFRAARADWELLSTRIGTFDASAQGMRNPGAVALASTLGRPVPSQFGGPAVSPAVQEINEHRDLFLLLVKEAEHLGIVVLDSAVEDRMNNLIVPETSDPQDRDAARRAVRSFMMAQAAFERLASAAKVSEPAMRRVMNTRLVQLRVNVVDFDANAVAATQPTTAPSAEQLRAQFDRYADVAPGEPTGDNPFGFGYRVPDRVRVQWLAVNPTAVRDAVLKGPPPGGASSWDVAALKYYYSNPTEFAAATQPATTQAATQPATQAAGATTRPSAELIAQAKDRVVQPEVDRRVGEIVARLEERFTAAYATAGPTTAQATTAPTTTATTVPAAGYGSYAFLEAAAADVQQRFGVLPATESRTGDWLTLRELGALPGIGGVWEFGQQAVGVATGAEGSPRLLALSRPLKAYDGTTFVYQVVAAQPAHRPQNLDVVREQVAADLRRVQAIDNAKAAAEQLLAAARERGLSAAASAAGKEVVAVGPISQLNQWMGMQDLPGYALPQEARAVFTDAAFRLLSSPTTAPSGQPVGVIPLPAANKVAVAQVVGTSPVDHPMLSRPGYQRDLELAHGLEQSEQQALQQEWFKWETVTARTDFRDEGGPQ